MTFQTHQFPYGNDNYGLLLHCTESGLTACVDAGDAGAVEAALTEMNWHLSHVFVTHHHDDHTAGLADLKQRHNVSVLGPMTDSAASALYDIRLTDGDEFEFSGRNVRVIATPGHTLDMLNFYIPAEEIVCTGDTLFVMGCGRIFEGNADMMWASLEKLLGLPDQTVIYCSHEYTLANATFARSVDPDNASLAAREGAVIELRDNGLPTVPTRLDLEKATNPFLRVDNAEIRAHLGMEQASNAEVFAEIRRRKDNF
jgi:hydroxyacylglutathione hydrolase